MNVLELAVEKQALEAQINGLLQHFEGMWKVKLNDFPTIYRDPKTGLAEILLKVTL